MSPRSHVALPPSTAISDAPPALGRDLAPAPGVTLVRGGADVCVYAGHADGVDLCLFEPGDSAGVTEERIPLRERAHGWWFGFVPDMGVGQRYGFRVHGAWAPEAGMRHNPDKLLVDPYAKALEGEVTWGPEVYGHEVDPVTWAGDPDVRSTLDSAGSMPRSVVVRDEFDWEGDEPLQLSRSETVIYETHVVNLTKQRPGVPEALRGTYAGMAHPDTIAHLKGLGVTAVELLPVHAFTSEPALVKRGLTNHWGYNTMGFLAPHGAYAAAQDPQGALDEFKGMVKLLH
ncbi:MAG TPA: glycogen debranching enzyme GlgX, partial [Phycicoccus sp.]|nr:glycogen debranching enzyme GlgX [Phycicoccus sp.]